MPKRNRAVCILDDWNNTLYIHIHLHCLLTNCGMYMYCHVYIGCKIRNVYVYPQSVVYSLKEYIHDSWSIGKKYSYTTHCTLLQAVINFNVIFMS